MASTCNLIAASSSPGPRPLASVRLRGPAPRPEIYLQRRTAFQHWTTRRRWRCGAARLDARASASLPIDGIEKLGGVELHELVDFDFEAHRAAGPDAPLECRVKNIKLTGGRLGHPRLPRGRISELHAVGTCDQSGSNSPVAPANTVKPTSRSPAAEPAGTPRRPSHCDAARGGSATRPATRSPALRRGPRKWWNRFRPAGNSLHHLICAMTGNSGGPTRRSSVTRFRLRTMKNSLTGYRMQPAPGATPMTEPTRGGAKAQPATRDARPRRTRSPATLSECPDRFARCLSGAPTGGVQIVGTDVTSHRQLIDALPEKARNVVNSLQPSGKFSFTWKAQRTSPNQPLMAILPRPQSS